MEPDVYWEVFCATGDPMAYLQYCGGEEKEEDRPTD